MTEQSNESIQIGEKFCMRGPQPFLVRTLIVDRITGKDIWFHVREDRHLSNAMAAPLSRESFMRLVFSGTIQGVTQSMYDRVTRFGHAYNMD